MQMTFFPLNGCTPCGWEETRVPRHLNEGGGEKTRGCYCEVIASTAVFSTGQITRDYGRILSVVG